MRMFAWDFSIGLLTIIGKLAINSTVFPRNQSQTVRNRWIMAGNQEVLDSADILVDDILVPPIEGPLTILQTAAGKTIVSGRCLHRTSTRCRHVRMGSCAI